MGQSIVLHNDEFDSLLLKSIDKALEDLLGANVKQALSAVLRKHYCLTAKQIPVQLHIFAHALDELFGPSNDTVGKAIARRLYSELELEFLEKSGSTLVDYVEEARAAAAATLEAALHNRGKGNGPRSADR